MQHHITQPQEPILIPKLRIYFADFPYLHCSTRLEAFHLRDLLRLWVRPSKKMILSLWFSRTVESAPDITKNCNAFPVSFPSSRANLIPKVLNKIITILYRKKTRERLISMTVKKKRQLFLELSPAFQSSFYVAIKISLSRHRNFNLFPFR